APPARLGFIARDGAIAGLITRADRATGLDEAFADGAPMRALWYADHSAETPRIAGLPGVPWRALDGESAAAPEVAPAPDDLAYSLYPSAPTGEPKGVMHTHASALAFADWAAETFAVGPEDRVAGHAPFHFDLSTFDLFASASGGAALYPVPARAASF